MADPARSSRGLGVALAILAGSVLAAWTTRLFLLGPSRLRVGAVAELAALARGWPDVVAAGLGGLLAAAAARRAGLPARGGFAVVALTLAAIGASVASAPVGHFAAIAAAGLALAMVAHALGVAAPALRASDRAIALAVYGLVVVVGLTFAIHRYRAFGAGSWDLGCMVHNFYRASRFLDTRSTVLGGVDFLGDHFMVGIYLYAPLVWLWSGAETVLAIQTLNVAAAAPVVFLIARRHGVGALLAAVLGLVTGFSFGMQSAMYFDAHEITVGIGFLALGLWYVECARYRAAALSLGIFLLFKESLGPYVVMLGLHAALRPLHEPDRAGDPRAARRFGLAMIALGALWFVLVNRVFMPALIARGAPPEPHETFADFGPTVFAAAAGIVRSPMMALGALFVPAQKVTTHLTTLGDFGYLAVFAPELLVPAAPLLAERFLSSKPTMWEMGYHYAAPLSLYAGWGTAIALGRLSRWLEPGGDPRRLARLEGAAAVFLGFMLLATNEHGYGAPANFHRWRPVYFASWARAAEHEAALDFVRAHAGRQGKLAVQNRLLPHVADRAEIHRLGDFGRADWVVLALGEDAWPWDAGYPRWVEQTLRGSPEWRAVFRAGGTWVFGRTQVVGDLPEVRPGAGVEVR